MNSQALAPPPPETERPEVSAPARKPWTRPVISLPRIQRTRIDRWPLALSLFLHALGVLFLITFLQLGPSDVVIPRDDTTQRIDFIELDWPVGVPADGVASGGPVAAPAAGGQPTTAVPARDTPGQISFPTTVPAGIPSAGAGTPTPTPGATAGGGTPAGAGSAPAGSLRGGAGFRDPRLYVSPETEALKRTDTRSNEQRYVDHLRERINASNDSVGIANRGPNTDWTLTDSQGRRWGISQNDQGQPEIHLGPITIPSPLVPRPTPTGSNQKIEEAREEERRRNEIRRQEEERELREAREAAARAARARADAARAGGSAPQN